MVRVLWSALEDPGLYQEFVAEKHLVAVFGNIHLRRYRICHGFQKNGHVRIAVRAVVSAGAGTEQNQAAHSVTIPAQQSGTKGFQRVPCPDVYG